MGAPAAEVLNTREWDVLIAGGGPAGLSAATHLANANLSVLLLEEHDDIGDPVHCTGVLGLDAFDELDLPRDSICSISRSACFFGRDGRSVRVDGGHVAAAVVDRGRFDRSLARGAAAAGAVVLRGARVETLEITPRAVAATLHARAGRRHVVRGRACILACGARYRFNRQFGLGIPGTYLQSAQAELPFVPLDDVEISLDRSLAPGGFAWVVPFTRNGSPMARVGLMASGDAANRFRQFTMDLARRHGVAARSRPRLKLLPLAPVKRTYADRLLAVGDAAGLAKPTTGGGIYYSLLSGRLAAEVLIERLEHDRTDAASLRDYESRWQARLGPELRAGLAFRALASRLDDRGVHALLDLAASDGIVPLLRATANVNWHRAAALALLRNGGFRRVVLDSLLGR